MTTTEVKAVVVESSQGSQNFSIPIPDGVTGGGGITGMVAAILLVALALRKRLSRDNLELTKDRAETNLIKTYQDTIKNLQEQNAKLDENARTAWRTRADDAQRIGILSSKVEHLSEVNETLRTNVQQMRMQMNDLVTLIRQMSPNDVRINNIIHGNSQSANPTEAANGN